MFELPEKTVGPVNRFQVLPRLSLRPLMLTGWPFHEGWLDTKASCEPDRGSTELSPASWPVDVGAG